MKDKVTAQNIAKAIEKAYKDFRVRIKVIGFKTGSDKYSFLFLVKLQKGTRYKNMVKYAEDVRVSIGFATLIPFADSSGVCLAVSTKRNDTNGLLGILQDSRFLNARMDIPIAVGYDILGEKKIVDLRQLVHLLVIGASGFGKSIALQCMVLSIISRCSVEEVRLILFDIGANSLSLFEDVQHLFHPIVKDTETGIDVLEALVAEIDDRMVQDKDEIHSLPYLICMIDEFDDMIASVEKKLALRYSNAINSIIRRGRKAKVILVLASHTPTVKTTQIAINGIMSRITFKCQNAKESYTALGETGAELLTAPGEMMFKAKDAGKAVMLRGAYISEEEIETFLGEMQKPEVDIDMLKIRKPEIMGDVYIGDSAADNEAKKELATIIYWVLGHKNISMNKIRERFNMSNRVVDIMKTLEACHIVTEQFSKQPRKVIPVCIGDLLPETVTLLEQYGYAKDQIEEVLRVKGEALCVETGFI